MEPFEVKASTIGMSPNRVEDIPTALEQAFRRYGIGLETCIPAIVERYDEDDKKEGKVVVRPLVNLKVNTGESIVRSVIKVSLQKIQVGGFLIELPLFVGDTGWVIASDRDASKVMALNSEVQEKDSLIKTMLGAKKKCNSGSQDPTTYLIHQYSKGFFVPAKWGDVGTWSNDTLKEEEDKIVVANINSDKESDAFISLACFGEANSKITITSTNGDININVDSPEHHLKLNGRNLYSDTNSTWAYYDGAFHNCVYQFAREFYVFRNGTYEAGDGCYMLSIPSDSPAEADIVVSDVGNSMVGLTTSRHNYADLTRTYVPIGKIEGGVMVEDFRNITGVPAYE